MRHPGVQYCAGGRRTSTGCGGSTLANLDGRLPPGSEPCSCGGCPAALAAFCEGYLGRWCLRAPRAGERPAFLRPPPSLCASALCWAAPRLDG